MGKNWNKDKETAHISDLLLVHSTNAAYLVRFQGQDMWIPKSQVLSIEFGKDLLDEPTGKNVKEIQHMELPKWLAKEKGLV